MSADGRVLVTGATGFVGRAMVARLVADGRPVRVAVRDERAARGEAAVVGEIGPETGWGAALDGVEAVVHLAGRAHVVPERGDPLTAFRHVNVGGTLALARQAAAAGVRRLVFVSSIGVNGGESERPFAAADPPAPREPYAVSKWEAEQGLAALRGIEVTVIRPPLVHGPGAPGNFARMLRWLARGAPLPLGAVRGNRRTLVGRDNLVDLIAVALDHPAAAGETFLAGDAEAVSTAALLEKLGAAMGRPARLVPVPPALLEAGAALLGRRDLARRLLGSLEVDISHARAVLGWTPPVGLDEGLRRAVEGMR